MTTRRRYFQMATASLPSSAAASGGREPLMTTLEAAEYLRLGSESAIRRLVREHALPYRRIGRRLRFDRSEIDVWSTAHRQPSALVRALKRV